MALAFPCGFGLAVFAASAYSCGLGLPLRLWPLAASAFLAVLALAALTFPCGFGLAVFAASAYPCGLGLIALAFLVASALVASAFICGLSLRPWPSLWLWRSYLSLFQLALVMRPQPFPHDPGQGSQGWDMRRDACDLNVRSQTGDSRQMCE